MARTRDDQGGKKSKEKHEDLKLAVPTKLFLICPLCVGGFGKKFKSRKTPASDTQVRQIKIRSDVFWRRKNTLKFGETFVPEN